MIDIVFLLIIFFMVAAQFAQQAHVELDLPLEIGEQQERTSNSTLVINILKNGNILLDKNVGAISLETLDKMLSDGMQTKQFDWEDITIRADENATSKALNVVITMLNKNGLAATKIATEAP